MDEYVCISGMDYIQTETENYIIMGMGKYAQLSVVIVFKAL